MPDAQERTPGQVDKVICEGVVYEKEVPRRTRLKNGKMGFRMHYRKRRCARQATDHFRGHDYCWQHVKQEKANRSDWDIPL